jgi:hypothetical protein
MEAGEKAPTCSVRSRRIIRDAQSTNDGRRSSEMIPATVLVFKSSHDPRSASLRAGSRLRGWRLRQKTVDANDAHETSARESQPLRPG